MRLFEEPREIVCDRVSGELMLETARTCRVLADAMGRVDVEITDGETHERFVRRMTRLQFFFRLVPSVLDPARIAALADRAAENPDWWRANRNHFFCPELTHRQIGDLLGLRAHQVRDYIKSAEIPRDVYDNLPPYQY